MPKIKRTFSTIKEIIRLPDKSNDRSILGIDEL